MTDSTSSPRRDVLRLLSVAPWLGSLPGVAQAEAAGPTVQPFPLADVRLLGGPFLRAQQLDARYLLSLDADRLLHGFRVNAGLPPKAPVYGGWESEEPWIGLRCQGHTLGHYLSACSMMAAASGEREFRRRAEYLVRELHACQRAGGSGLVCAFPDGDTQLRNGLAGRPVSGVPWYTLHKVAAGLRDAYLHVESRMALDVLRRLADWIVEAARDCDDAGLQRMLDVEHGGMNEVLADVSALTGDARYLALARRFNHRALLDPLAAERDVLDGLHANTQIPKVVGFARLHALTGDATYARAASYFWGRVAGPRSFATGGHGDWEHFFPPAESRTHLGSAKTAETCGIHNMLRLTQLLFQRDPQVHYADWAERALVNGILGSQDPDSGMFTYFQPLRPGYPKLYCTPERSFWCCTGTGMENHARYGESVYFASGDVLYVSQYIASDLAWRERGLHLSQVSGFPERGASRLLLRAARPVRLTLRLRHPAWCRRMSVQLDGKVIATSDAPGQWLDIEREWRDGDRLDIELPMHLHLAPLQNAPDVAAVMYGPMALAARLGTQGIEAGADLIVNERNYGEPLRRDRAMPRLALAGRELTAAVRRRPGGALAFVAQDLATDEEVELVPYHRIAHERYSLYWQLA